MIPTTLGEVARLAGADLAGLPADAPVTDVVADSRAAGPGTVFVALPGEPGDLPQGRRDHAVTCCRSSRSTSRSSKGVTTPATS